MAAVADFEAFCAPVGLRLEPFQRRIARLLFGPAHETLVLLPRGNGKSALVGAYAVHHLLTVPQASVYVAAASRDQASVVYGYARRFAQAADAGLVLRHLELRAPDGGGLRVLASDAPKLHGLTPSLAIIDELWAHIDAEVYLALKTAQLKRPGCRVVTVSTPGQGDDSPLGRLRARALAQPHVTRQGAVTEAHGPSLAMMEWSVPDDADCDDPRVVKRANPASWITTGALREQRDAVPDLAFRQLHAGQWVGREGAWLSPGDWQACVDCNMSIEPGEPVFVGVDGGSRRGGIQPPSSRRVRPARSTSQSSMLSAPSTIA